MGFSNILLRSYSLSYIHTGLLSECFVFVNNPALDDGQIIIFFFPKRQSCQGSFVP